MFMVASTSAKKIKKSSRLGISRVKLGFPSKSMNHSVDFRNGPQAGPDFVHLMESDG